MKNNGRHRHIQQLESGPRRGNSQEFQIQKSVLSSKRPELYNGVVSKTTEFKGDQIHDTFDCGQFWKSRYKRSRTMRPLKGSAGQRSGADALYCNCNKQSSKKTVQGHEALRIPTAQVPGIASLVTPKMKGLRMSSQDRTCEYAYPGIRNGDTDCNTGHAPTHGSGIPQKTEGKRRAAWRSKCCALGVSHKLATIGRFLADARDHSGESQNWCRLSR